MRQRLVLLLVLLAVVSACGGSGSPQNDSTTLGGTEPQTSSSAQTTLPPEVTTSTAETIPGAYAVDPGRHVITIEVEGVDREYTLLIPESVDLTSPVPLVIGFHGWGGDAESIIGSVQQWGAVAEEHGFLLIAPEGLPGTFFGSEGAEWAVLEDEDELSAFEARPEYGPQDVYEYFYDELAEFSTGSRDVEFTAAILDQASSHLPVDPNRVFVTGFSLGGWMASRVACDLEGQIAGLAPTFHSLLISQPCTTQSPVSVASVGDSLGYQRLAAQALDDWATHHGCSPQSSTHPTTDSFSRRSYTDCPQQVLVEFRHSDTETTPGQEAEAAWDFFESTR